MNPDIHRLECIPNRRREDPTPSDLSTLGDAEIPGSDSSEALRLRFRPPCESDAADIWQLVSQCEELDSNSPYAYLLLSTDFAQSGLVIRATSTDGPAPAPGSSTTTDSAAPSTTPTPPGAPGSRPTTQSTAKPGDEGPLLGFVLGYVPPGADDTLFVWQVGVAPDARGRGLGRTLLENLMDRCRKKREIAFLEATVTPSNTPSRMLFTNFARDRGAPVQESVAFSASSFPSIDGEAHEDEIRLRIGPLEPTSR